MARMYNTKALLEWKERVELWIKIYGREQPDVKTGCNLTGITVVKKCAKCGKWKDKMQRHHIGSEMAFAKILPQYYARRYVSFLPEDIVWLCSRHHKDIHVLYYPLMQPVYEYARVCQIQGQQPSPHHLELLRMQIRKAFDEWVNRKPYKKKKVKGMLDLMGNKVAISPIGDPDVSEGGIIIPDIAKERADQGIVKYVGPDVRYLKPGDYVLFSGYAGMKIYLQGEGAFIIMYETEVQAILYDEPTTLTNVYFRAADGGYFQATYEMVHEVLVRDISESAWYKRNKEKYIAREAHFHKDESSTTRTEWRRKNEVSETDPFAYDTYEKRGDYDADEEESAASG